MGQAIVSMNSGPEYYVGVLSFVDQEKLEPGCSILLHNKSHTVVRPRIPHIQPRPSLPP
jgi:26S proteasome regulatory subunit T2